MHPILFQIGSLTIYSYGALVAAAFALCFWTAKRRAGQFGLSSSDVSDFVLLFFVSGVVGSRIFFVAEHLSDYRENFLGALNFREGGLVWYGGLAAAIGSGMILARVRHLRILTLADFFSPTVSLGQAVGRIGCFLNGCCYGTAVRAGFQHPVQLYESAWLFLLSLALAVASKSKRKPGLIFIFYLEGASLGRFSLEFLRADHVALGFLTLPQWISAVVFFLAAAAHATL